MNIIHKTEYS